MAIQTGGFFHLTPKLGAGLYDYRTDPDQNADAFIQTVPLKDRQTVLRWALSCPRMTPHIRDLVIAALRPGNATFIGPTERTLMKTVLLNIETDNLQNLSEAGQACLQRIQAAVAPLMEQFGVVCFNDLHDVDEEFETVRKRLLEGQKLLSDEQAVEWTYAYTQAAYKEFTAHKHELLPEEEEYLNKLDRQLERVSHAYVDLLERETQEPVPKHLRIVLQTIDRY